MLLLRSHHLLLPHAARLLARRASPLPRAAAAAPRLRPLRMSTSNSSASASSPAAPSPTPVATALTSQGPCGPSYQLYLASSGHPLLSQITVPKSRIPFCPACGSPTKLAVPDGDEKMRAVCSSCGRVHYENPKMVVGCLVEHDNKVLLCRRKIEPAYGLWTLPAGYLEVGESAAEGASRETLEEACADVEIVSPFAQLDIPLIGQ